MRRPVSGVDTPCQRLDPLSRHGVERSGLGGGAKFRNDKLIRRASAFLVATWLVQRDPVLVMVQRRPPRRRGDKARGSHEDHQDSAALRSILATVAGYQGPPRLDVKPASLSAVPISRKLHPRSFRPSAMVTASCSRSKG